MKTLVDRQMKWVTDLVENIGNKQRRFIVGKAFNTLMVKVKVHSWYPADVGLANELAQENGFILVSWNVVIDRADLCLVVTMFLDNAGEQDNVF